MKRTEHNHHDRNISDHRLPGNSLIDAIHNRKLMMLSDRGGASQHIGDQWAKHVSQTLDTSLRSIWRLPGQHQAELVAVIRLDENRAIERDANRHQLENPDFLIIGRLRGAGEPVLFAADAKFAADRIKSSQVSQEIVQQLIDVPDQSTAHALITQAIEEVGIDWPQLINGVFVSPDSTMTDMLLARGRPREPGAIDADQIVRIPPDPTRLFAGLPMSSIIGTLARQDRLPVTPRSNLLAAVYYFRLACACLYLWQEEHRPLFSLSTEETLPDPAVLGGIVAGRARYEHTAYDVIQRWHRDVERVISKRKAIQDVVRLPITMREIRDEVAKRSVPQQRDVVKLIRRDLEIAFRSRIIDETGEIPADDPRSLPQILDDVAAASRSLRSSMRALLDQSLETHATAMPDDREVTPRG